jgi:hypothetical protein
MCGDASCRQYLCNSRVLQRGSFLGSPVSTFKIWIIVGTRAQAYGSLASSHIRARARTMSEMGY